MLGRGVPALRIGNEGSIMSLSLAERGTDLGWRIGSGQEQADAPQLIIDSRTEVLSSVSEKAPPDLGLVPVSPAPRLRCETTTAAFWAE